MTNLRLRLMCCLSMLAVVGCSAKPTDPPSPPVASSSSGAASQDIVPLLPYIPPGYDGSTLMLIQNARNFWATLPVIVYRVEHLELVQMDLVNHVGEMYKRDFRNNSWSKGSLKQGMPIAMATSEAPGDVWLAQLDRTAALLVMDGRVAIPAPLLKQMLGTPRSSPTPIGEVYKLVQIAADHLTREHLGDSLVYSGCHHQEFVNMAAAVVSHSFRE